MGSNGKLLQRILKHHCFILLFIIMEQIGSLCNCKTDLLPFLWAKLLLLILTEFLLSMVRPATVWFVYFFLLFVKCCFCVSLVSKSTVVAAYKFFCVVQKRDWKRCMDSAYVLRFRPVRVRKIGILKHSPDCMLVQQDSSNWPRDSVMDFHFSFFFLCHFIDLFES